jgi:hypothetical protein
MRELISTSEDYINIVEGYFHEELSGLQSSGKELDSYVIDTLRSRGLYSATNRLYFHEKIVKCLKEIDEFWEQKGPDYNSKIKNIKGNIVTVEAFPYNFELLSRYATYFDYIIIRDIPWYDNYIKNKNWTWEHLVNPFKYLLQIMIFKKIIIDNSPFIFLGSTIVGYNSEDAELLHKNEEWLHGEINNYIYADKEKTKINGEALSKFISAENQHAQLLGPFDRKMAKYKSIVLKLILNSNSDLISYLLPNYQHNIKTMVHELISFNHYSTFYNTPFAYSSLQWVYYEFRKSIIEKEFQLKFYIPDNILISYAFQNEFKWLKNLSLYDTLKLRNEGFLEELQSYFRMTLHKLDQYSLTDSKELAKSLNDEFKQFLNEKSKEIEVNQKMIYKKAKLTKISFGTTVALTIASLAVPALLPLSLLSSLFGLSFGKGIKDIINVKKEKDYTKFLKKSPAAILVEQFDK